MRSSAMTWVWMSLVAATACSPGDAPGGAPADAASVDAPLATSCPDTPGTMATLAPGHLVGMDATRLFIEGRAGLQTWPKRGGVPSPFPSAYAGSGLAISGDSYYWIAPDGLAIHVTGADGALRRSVPLASRAITLAVAPEGGVYALTRCLAYDPQCPLQGESTIELILDGAAPPQTIVIRPAGEITAIASGPDALVWWQAASSPQASDRIMKRDPRTGLITPLVDPIGFVGGDGTLLIAGDDLFSSVETAPLVIERRSLVDGSLRDSYAIHDEAAGSRTAAYWLAADGDLYWTEPTAISISSAGACPIPTGLFRLRLPAQDLRLIDASAAASRVLIDPEVVYYTYRSVDLCCSGNGHTCTVPAPVEEVRCYRKP